MNNQEVWGVWAECQGDPSRSFWYGDGTGYGVQSFQNWRDVSGQSRAEAFARDRQASHGSGAFIYSARNMAQQVEVKVEVPTPPTVETLARAIFNTDERVGRDIDRFAGEGGGHWAATPTTTQICSDSGAHRPLAPYFDKAWDSNRNNWRTEAEAKATTILAELNRLGK